MPETGATDSGFPADPDAEPNAGDEGDVPERKVQEREGARRERGQKRAEAPACCRTGPPETAPFEGRGQRVIWVLTFFTNYQCLRPMRSSPSLERVSAPVGTS
ncbi:hypothetical protein GCM10022252_06000 [Streptosporangium oxazolinicum]|uniref:Uncharacterized protein n=1 Tax=Streptosporangium oxazolinicum TaxID=909287 RepID=A0ABP8AC61_9ACTN